MSSIAAVDESGASGDLGEFIDEVSLEAQNRKAAQQNRKATGAYRDYLSRVVQTAGVRDSQLTRQLASNICGSVARLPFLPDDEEKLDGDKTEYDLQVEKTAEQAESALGSEVVWTVTARKIARTALDLRKQDPDGDKGIAWVNEPFDPERGPKRRAVAKRRGPGRPRKDA